MDEEIEEKYVHEFYRNASFEFSAKRNSPWQPVRNFLSEFWSNEMISLDYGCGCGRNLPKNGVGLDISRELLMICQGKKNPLSLVLSSGLSIPFKDNSFDLILNVAVIQHLSTEERRYIALNECYRVLKPGRKSFISVTSESIKSFKSVKIINTNDVLIPIKRVNEYLRYYHLFNENEFHNLIIKTGFKIIKKGFYQNNYFVEVEK